MLDSSFGSGLFLAFQFPRAQVSTIYETSVGRLISLCVADLLTNEYFTFRLILYLQRSILCRVRK